MTLAELTAAEREDYEERASIYEFEAGMSREVAEREALRVVAAKRDAGRGRLPFTSSSNK